MWCCKAYRLRRWVTIVLARRSIRREPPRTAPRSVVIHYRAILILAAQIASIRTSQNNHVLRIQVPPDFRKYIFPKGYIAINGASLTVSEVDRSAGWFEVWLIPETRRMTVFEQKQVGDWLNIEIERGTQVVVDTVRASMHETLGALMPALEALLAQRGTSLDDFIAPLSLPQKTL